MPCSYTVRLTVDGTATTAPLTVKPDPRDPAVSRYQERYDCLSALYRDLEAIAAMLNQIDTRRSRATPKQAAELTAFRQKLTYGPRNIEDLSGPAGLGERVLDLISRLSTSFQAPTAVQRAQADQYQAEVERFRSEYK